MSSWKTPVRAMFWAALALQLAACQTISPNAIRTVPREAAETAVASTSVSGKVKAADATAAVLSTEAGRIDDERLPSSAEEGKETPHAPDLWQRLRAEFRFIQCTPQASMHASLRGFTAHPDAFERMFERAITRLDYVATRLASANIPAEFALLPMVESRYQIGTKRPGSTGPAGPWQMMRHTARAMGLTVDTSHDARMDLVASTDAAIRLLESLYAEFNDWTLVNLAYNAGDGRVRGALRRSGGWHGDAYALPLSPITRAHFSRLRALVCICTDPERYGLTLPASPDGPIAQSKGKGRGEATAPATHVVASGDSLSLVGQRYRVALDKLRLWNSLDNRALLHPGQVLRLISP